jgi:sarcosine oxidase delta subunit
MKDDEKKKPEQLPKDPEKQNKKQEREYRKQKEGKLRPLPDKDTGDDSTERYIDIKENQEGKSEEE